MRGGWAHIVTNKPNGVLYLGVTSNLSQRIWQHKTGAYEGFTKRYGLKTIVWYEPHDDIRTAIQRERTMKHWSRARKVRLILDMNEDWRDLYETLA